MRLSEKISGGSTLNFLETLNEGCNVVKEDGTPALDAALGVVDDTIDAAKGAADGIGDLASNVKTSDVDTDIAAPVEEAEEKEEDKEELKEDISTDIGGDYDDLIDDLQNFRRAMNEKHGECGNKLAQQIIEDTIAAFDDLLKRYEMEKDIEIIGAMDEGCEEKKEDKEELEEKCEDCEEKEDKE